MWTIVYEKIVNPFGLQLIVWQVKRRAYRQYLYLHSEIVCSETTFAQLC